MKGVKVDSVGGEYSVTEDLPNPSPGPNQILVKAIYVAVNPVDELMRTSGLLITSFPWTPGCEVAGPVVEVGSEITNFKVGDYVFGSPGVGFPGSGSAAEYVLFTAEFAFKKPDNVTLEAAASIGVGLMTAALGLYNGLDVALPDPNNLPAVSDKWVLVLGGGGSVGGYAVQLAKISGYKVIASVSNNSIAAATENGADETIDYKAPVEEQIAKIKDVTQGGLHRIIDTTSYNIDTVKKVLESIKDQPGQKFFTSTNDWEPFGDLPGDAKFYPIALGPIARPDSKKLNADVVKFIEHLQPLIDSGTLKPSRHFLVPATGFQAFVEAVLKPSGSAKNVVKVQDE